MKQTTLVTFAISLMLPLFGTSAANAADTVKPGSGAAPSAQSMSEATVGKIDKAAGKVTLSHGPIPNLEMPPMTMVFRVKDKAWLDQMKQGDKIRFAADQINGAYTVVQFEPQR